MRDAVCWLRLITFGVDASSRACEVSTVSLEPVSQVNNYEVNVGV